MDGQYIAASSGEHHEISDRHSGVSMQYVGRFGIMYLKGQFLTSCCYIRDTWKETQLDQADLQERVFHFNY